MVVAPGASHILGRSGWQFMREAARIRRGALLDERPLQRLIDVLVPAHDISELATPLSVTTTCLDCGVARHHRSGPVPDTLLASCALPGLFAPVGYLVATLLALIQPWLTLAVTAPLALLFLLGPSPRATSRTDRRRRKTIRSRDEWDKCVERGGPSLTVIRGKTHYAASLMSAADQQIPDDTRVVLEELITETGR